MTRCCTDEFLDAEESDEDDGDTAYNYGDLAAAFGGGSRSGSDVDEPENASDVEADSSDTDQPNSKFESRDAGSGSDEGDALAMFHAFCQSAPWYLSNLAAPLPACFGNV